MADENREFVKTLRAFTFLPRRRVEFVMRELTRETLDAVYRFSPVLTGQFRDSWNTSIGAPDTELPDPKKYEKLASIPMFTPLRGRPNQKFRSVRAKIKAESEVYITNAQPYADRLEKGYSSKAPQGVVTPAVALMLLRVEKIAAKALREVPDVG